MYLISACLAGVNCRYDGKNTRNEILVRLVEEGRAIAVCPEVLGGLPIPRPPCEMIRWEDGTRRVIDKDGTDRTDAFLNGAARTLDVCKAAGIHKAILKQGSPSCGCGVIHDGMFTGVEIPGNGVTAHLLTENGIEVMSETDWPDHHAAAFQQVSDTCREGLGQTADARLDAQANPSLFTETMVDMTWPAIAERAGEGDIILLPVGIIEAHGPHMDLGADILLAHLYCRLLRHELESKSIHALLAPPVYWGCAADMARYAGTFSVKPETMKALLTDILSSLSGWGFRKAFLVNCHGDRTHIRMIEEAILEANGQLAMQTTDLSRLEIQLENPPVFPQPREGRFEPDYHAGAIETAQMHAFFPKRVNADLARILPPSDSFHPMAYCGDPAGFELEDGIAAYYRADLETDARKIELFLSRNFL